MFVQGKPNLINTTLVASQPWHLSNKKIAREHMAPLLGLFFSHFVLFDTETCRDIWLYLAVQVVFDPVTIWEKDRECIFDMFFLKLYCCTPDSWCWLMVAPGLSILTILCFTSPSLTLTEPGDSSGDTLQSGSLHGVFDNNN